MREVAKTKQRHKRSENPTFRRSQLCYATKRSEWVHSQHFNTPDLTQNKIEQS